MNATARIPQATLRDEWTVAVTQRWARAFTASTTVSRASGAADRTVAEPARRGSAPAEAAQRDQTARVDRLRRTDALLRLASDERATPHERALAADRAAALLRRSA